MTTAGATGRTAAGRARRTGAAALCGRCLCPPHRRTRSEATEAVRCPPPCGCPGPRLTATGKRQRSETPTPEKIGIAAIVGIAHDKGGRICRGCSPYAGRRFGWYKGASGDLVGALRGFDVHVPSVPYAVPQDATGKAALSVLRQLPAAHGRQVTPVRGRLARPAPGCESRSVYQTRYLVAVVADMGRTTLWARPFVDDEWDVDPFPRIGDDSEAGDE